MIVNPDQKEAIEAAIVEALEKYNAFAFAYRGEKSNLVPDLELVVKISAPSRAADMMESEMNNNMYYNSFLWLLSGFPGYLLADTEVASDVKITYTLSRNFEQNAGGKQSELTGAGDSMDVGTQALNFLDRAGAWQYVQSIIIPPPLVASNEAVVDESLYEGFVEKMQRYLGRSIKEDLVKAQMGKKEPGPVLQAHSNEDGKTYVFLFSNKPEAESKIRNSKKTISWEDLTSESGKAYLKKIPRVKRSDSYGMYTNNDYQRGYVAQVETQDLLENGNGMPKQIQVEFRGDDNKSWSWTPLPSRGQLARS
jgi:hypothetical protein